MLRVVLSAVLLSLAATARADQVHLKSGAVIEGKATRAGDQVLIEIESGQIGFPAEEVERIESSASAVQEFEAKLAALEPRDIEGRLELANYCRERDMRGREEQMLREVIALAPNHEEARERLGFVKRDGRWVDHEQQLREEGFVLFEGRWLKAEQVVEIERLRTQAAIAARERERAEIQLAAAKADLEAREREAEAAARAQQMPYVEPPVVYAAPVYSWGWRGAHHRHRHHDRACTGPRCARRPFARRPDGRPPWPIAGAKDPFDYLRE